MRTKGIKGQKGPEGPAGNTDKKQGPGILYVVATPIGNLEDITRRAIRILGEVDLIAAEDTRHTRKLLTHLGISKPMLSYFKDKEMSRAGQVLDRLLAGSNVALVSDAGTPAISDPGHILVARAMAAGIKVMPVPGPAALTAALSVAGLPASPLFFVGFLPARPAERRACLTRLANSPCHLVFYESPHRLRACLKDCLAILGDRQIFWAREITKIHEELRTASLSLLVRELEGRQVKGESVLIIPACKQQGPPADLEIDELLRWYREESGESLKDCVQRVAADLGLPRTEVYQKALRIWREKTGS